MPTVPILTPDNRRRLWFKEEIFTGPSGTGEFVPNVNDGVIDLATGFSKVLAVDVDHLSTLDPVTFTNGAGGATQEDAILANGPNAQSEAWRVYINSDVVPPTLAIDSSINFYGDSAEYVKVFLGTDIGGTGHVISAIYNISNVLLSENIPLVLVGNTAGTNIAIKAPVVASSMEPVATGEVVTVVAYDASDVVTSIKRMTVFNSNFVHSSDEGRIYIVAIELLSPFLSITDSHLLEYPVNLLLQSATLQGKLTYSDGSTAILPIDGGRFELMGMERFIPSREGMRVDLMLKYNLQPNEYAYGVSAPLPERSLVEDYRLVTVAGLADYNVKLYVVPKWNVGTNKWELDYYLYSLERNIVILATPYIEYVSNSVPFNGEEINTRQHIRVVVNLSNLSLGFLSYRYPQAFSIQLKALATNNLAPTFWIIEYQEGEFYGSGLYAHASVDPGNPSMNRLDLSLGLLAVEDWIDKVYYAIMPQRTPAEVAAPQPTHVRLRIGNVWVREIPINDILSYVTAVNIAVPPSTTLRLEFIRRTSTDLELGVASMNVRG